MAVLKRILPTAIAISVGILVLITVFTSYPELDTVGTYLIDTAVIIASFALFLGIVNVLRVHSQKIQKRPGERPYSIVLIAAMLIVLAVGLPSLPGRPSGPSQPIVQWIFENIQAPIQASLSALLVFLVVTAAYRLLMVRNIESAVMLAVVLLVLPELKEWILDVPTLAGVRGILLGVALGALLTGIRLLLGVERPYSD